jgi:hypothetical protein
VPGLLTHAAAMLLGLALGVLLAYARAYRTYRRLRTALRAPLER